jgi:hypothetical protein
MRINHTREHLLLAGAFLALMALPAVGSIVRSGSLPPDITIFPLARETIGKPGLSLWYLAAAVAAALVILAFLVFPAWFGFRVVPSSAAAAHGRVGPPASAEPRRFPWWFPVGVFMLASSWAAMWFGAASVAKYSFVPLWWGFILTTDGVVFRLNGCRSLISGARQRFLILALVSVPAWALFEYMNYFALAFWIYPSDQIFSPAGQALWYLLSFSTVWPTVFEWYTLLGTSEALRRRWANGPKVQVPRRWTAVVAVVGMAAMVAFGVWPFQLFALLWVGPPLVLIAALGALGFWTPLRPIERGNWSPLVLVALASLVNGVFWELWNYGTAVFQAPSQTNPNYWQYRIPYVDVLRPFSEMPILGYFGYLPFGVLVWVCWLAIAHILDLEPDFDVRSMAARAPESAAARIRSVPTISD